MKLKPAVFWDGEDKIEVNEILNDLNEMSAMGAGAVQGFGVKNKDERIARFDAYSGWAFLYCGGNPSYSGGGLGVFACAEIN